MGWGDGQWGVMGWGSTIVLYIKTLLIKFRNYIPLLLKTSNIRKIDIQFKLYTPFKIKIK